MRNEIRVGSLTAPTAIFTPDNIHEITGKLSAAIIGDTLSVDTIEATVGNAIVSRTAFRPEDYDGMLEADLKRFYSADVYDAPADQTLVAGMPLFWLHGADLKGKFFVSSVVRTGRNRYQVNAVSAVGLLDAVWHTGGVYTGQTAETVLGEIIGDTFTYSVDAAAGGQRVYGWLPYDTARNNLHKLLLALGIGITKDDFGDPVFGFVEAGEAHDVPDDRIFLGGSVRRDPPASRVEVTAHSYIRSWQDEEVIAFDNTDGLSAADYQLVIFDDAPLHDLHASDGLTVHSSGANFAVISGAGTLTGKRYTHAVQAFAADNPAAAKTNVKRLDGDTLVNPVNAENVLARLYAYYTRSDTVQADMKVEDELPNQLVTMTDAFGDQRSAWLKSMDFRATTMIKAATELVDDYSPGSFGNLFTDVQRITADGSWTVPAGVTRLLVVLIGGGNGGDGGYDGKTGRGNSATIGGDMYYDETDTMRIWYYQGGMPVGGEGGAPGAAGENGRTLSLDLAVNPGDVLTFSIGAGGTGGDSNGGIGTAGTETTAVIGGTEYSTASGILSRTGVPDLMDATVYGAPGEPGHAGGMGGYTTVSSTYGWNGDSGQRGESVGYNSGGAGGSGLKRTFVDTIQGAGGGGGGAAYGSDGSAGGDASYREIIDGQTVIGTVVIGGTGGDGADAQEPDAATYGSGGGGGNGGGGGGNGGGSRIDSPNLKNDDRADFAFPGNGGSGSRGGDGGAGIALIYYKAVI